MKRPAPEWFTLCEEATPMTMQRLASVVADPDLPLQVRRLPLQAHWFVLDSLLLANKANREGMHAVALALTRQCIESIAVIETGICRNPEAGQVLLKWERDALTSGELRKWLSENVWNTYGCGLWSEPWTDFMGSLAKAVQPYAHYTSHLAKWQLRLLGPGDPENTLLLECAPRAYDAQKATRITLFHAILTFALARMYIAASSGSDTAFEGLIEDLRKALSQSEYLDGHETNWAQQFWALLWLRSGGTILE